MKKIGVYILECSNGRYYIGSTCDLNRRLDEHDNGSVRATRQILPISLKFFHPCTEVQHARQIEYKLKRKKNRRILKKIISDGQIKFVGS